MTLPVTVPNQFANATSSIPLSQLDSNFNTLSNVINQINAGTQQLSNANVATLIVTGNATIGDASTDTVTLNSTLTANTAVIFTAGTSAAPSITTTGDTNTGIFFPAADTIAFAEGGAEAMRIDSSSRALIGSTTARSNLFNSTVTSSLQVEGTTSDNSSILIARNSNDTTGAIVALVKSRGGSVGSNTVVQSGDNVGLISFQGSDGTEFVEAARIQVAVDGTPGANDMPGRIEFRTTADGGTSTTEQMRLTSDGYLRMASGSGGIQFNGDTAAANALDDYEEGTWTPTANLGGTACTVSTSASYTKIGNLVYCRMELTITNKGAGVGNIGIGGLPFSSTTFGSGNMQVSSVSLPSGAGSIMPYSTGTTARMLYQTNLNHADMTNTNINNNGSFYGFFVYLTS